MSCTTIIVAKEEHSEKGHHYHMGILMEKGIQRKRAPRTRRETFPEFEGAQFLVSFNKAWTSICEYILKEDPNPY